MTIQELQAQQDRIYRESIIETVNGRVIRTVNTRFGVLYAVEGTGMAYATIEEARSRANLSHAFI